MYFIFYVVVVVVDIIIIIIITVIWFESFWEVSYAQNIYYNY